MKSEQNLRDTFASAARDAGVDWFTLKMLMNHRLPSNDMAAPYVSLTEPDGLRDAAEKVAEDHLESAGQPTHTMPRPVFARLD